MFCNPCSASSAILPHSTSLKEDRYALTDGSDGALFDEKLEPHSDRSLTSSLKLKIKPSYKSNNKKQASSSSSQSQQQQFKQLEQELFLLSSELCWKNGNIHEYQHQLLTTSLNSFIYYECGQQIMTSVQIKSPLIIVLRNTIQGVPIAYNTQNVWILLLHALHSFNRLLNQFEKQQNHQNHHMFPMMTELFQQQQQIQSNNNNNNPLWGDNGHHSSFTSIEHIFMMAVSVIFMSSSLNVA